MNDEAEALTRQVMEEITTGIREGRIPAGFMYFQDLAEYAGTKDLGRASDPAYQPTFGAVLAMQKAVSAWLRAGRPDPAADAALVRDVKAEILADIEAGTVPATVADFEELRRYVDADAYGDCGPEVSAKRAAAMEQEITDWLRSGRPTEGQIMPGTEWERYDACTTCGVQDGQPCLDLRFADGRTRVLPHRGRPARRGRNPIGGGVYVQLGDQLARVDTYKDRHGLSRAEAVRRLVGLALDGLGRTEDTAAGGPDDQ